MRKACLDMVHELAGKDPRIVFIGSDLGHGTLADFAREIPERFFMEGISEANVIGMASGLALCGKIVYVNTIASFLTRRCFEQIVLDLCLHKARVRLIGNGGGMVYAPLGPTHETVEDIAVMRALPNMTVVAPADAEEMKRLMPQTVDYPGPIYIRLAKGYDPIVSADAPPFLIGKGLIVRNGTGALLITTGITLKIAMEAADLLNRHHISSTILHLPTIKPLDHEAILRCAGQVAAIVTIEEHSIIGGLGGAVAEVIAEADFDSPKRFKRLGLPDIFPDDYGSQDGLLKRYQLTPEHVTATVRSLL